MNTWVIVGIIVLICVVIPAGRWVVVVALGIIYLPLQHLFVALQKLNLHLKEKDTFLFYLSCIFIYPLYLIIIPFSKIYETFVESLH